MGTLPVLTHLQYLSLKILQTTGPHAGETLRTLWTEEGAGHRSLPAFYQFMGRLEEGGFVGARRTRQATGHLQTTYRILKKGKVAMNKSEEFYDG